jgi:hypothetical protein
VINVLKAFSLQLDPKQIGTVIDDKTKEEKPVYAQEGERVEFVPGPVDVPEHIANHWYVQAHLEGFVEPPPKPTMADFAQRQLLAARAARNNTSVDEAAPPPAVSPRGVPAAHYFAGHKLEDQPAPPVPSWVGH